MPQRGRHRPCSEHADAIVNDALARLRAVDVKRDELMELYKD